MACARPAPAKMHCDHNLHRMHSLCDAALVREERDKAVESVRSSDGWPCWISTQPVASHSVSAGHKGKNWQNCKRTVLSGMLFAAVVSTVAVIGVHAATAHPISSLPLIAPGEPQPWVPQTVPQRSTTYCSRSTITGDEFMKLIQKIISHGDLADVGFIEKTLGTKFDSSYGWKEDGTPDTLTLYYNAAEVLGNPIRVEIDAWSKTMQKKRKEIADISFGYESEKNFTADCLHLKTEELFVFFGNNFFTVGPNGLLPIKEAYQNQGTLGKDGTRLYLSISFDVGDKLINGIEIIQKK